MAKNTGKGYRVGAVRKRSQTTTGSANYVKRDAKTGRFISVKTVDKDPYKGIRKEK